MKILASVVGLALLASLPAAGNSDRPEPPSARMSSRVLAWATLAPDTPTPTGARRAVFDAPTPTLDRFHCHVTTLNPGENTGPLHRHPQEEVVIIKEGTMEVNIDGRKLAAGPGALIFFAANENENLTNIGPSPATYYVLQWFTPATPQG